VEVREVAAAAAGNLDLAPDAVVVLDDEDGAPAPPGLHRAHQPRRPAADDDHVVFHGRIINKDGQDRQDKK
jgi:hypothetical protein